MLNGDGNENGKKGLINKKTNFARAAHFSVLTFLCRFFAKLPSYTFTNCL